MQVFSSKTRPSCNYVSKTYSLIIGNYFSSSKLKQEVLGNVRTKHTGEPYTTAGLSIPGQLICSYILISSMYMYMYVCKYVCMYAIVYVCIYLGPRIFVHT
jgi:hypothetical protein